MLGNLFSTSDSVLQIRKSTDDEMESEGFSTPSGRWIDTPDLQSNRQERMLHIHDMENAIRATEVQFHLACGEPKQVSPQPPKSVGQFRAEERSPEGSIDNNVPSPSDSRASSIASSSRRNSKVNFKKMQQTEPERAPLTWIRPSSLPSDAEDSTASSVSAHHSSDTEDQWHLQRSSRPAWEPPVLDYRKFEEGGSMYHSLNRHPDTRPEDWYAYTDAEIEVELLGDYHSWIYSCQREAITAGDTAREAFYSGLNMEVDTDRLESERTLDDVKEAVYQGRPKTHSSGRPKGSRVQQQFDEVRKRWCDVDSLDSDWDEQEWEIFGPPEDNNQPAYALTELNLRKLAQPTPQELEKEFFERGLLESCTRASFLWQLFARFDDGTYYCHYINCGHGFDDKEKIVQHVQKHLTIVGPAHDLHNEYLGVRWECFGWCCQRSFPELGCLEDHHYSIHVKDKLLVADRRGVLPNYTCKCGAKFHRLPDLSSHRKLESCLSMSRNAIKDRQRAQILELRKVAKDEPESRPQEEEATSNYEQQLLVHVGF